MKNLFLGIDIGSISVKAILLDEKHNVHANIYRRMFGKPLPVLAEILKELRARHPGVVIQACGATGTGGELAASLIGGVFYNEVVAQSRAIGHLHPEVRTVIEMGGQDSKLMIMKADPVRGAVLEDFAMNTVCAAGTGSFLDQQATRLGCPIDKEFGELALRSKNPARVAGRCSVFAKSDMIHLQQIGTPKIDIIAGLCHAVARSFKSNIARGKKMEAPIAFVGGVASNIGVVKAFESELELADGALIIPELHNVTGAFGAALSAMDPGQRVDFLWEEPVEEYLRVRQAVEGAMDPLHDGNGYGYDIGIHPVQPGAAVYIGIDIGSLSTNVVAIDEQFRVVARRYLRTSGQPIQMVTQGLLEIGEEIADKVVVKGVGTTGSGRYMIGDFAGADAVRNEITAQATAAVHFVPDVESIFEIGGQDSKYIAIKDGAVVDFEMNKVCAAGTGSFIEEQAERLGLDIKKDFSDAAFSAPRPGKFGERCTVFIESDLVANQQKGSPAADLAAGLAYSIVRNYLSVVGDRIIGSRVLFQGGVAWNRAVVAAFGVVTGKKIKVPPHHDCTGAVGAAIIAARYMRNRPDMKTRFKGFDLRGRGYKVTSFECKACENVCDVSRVKFVDEPAHYYGARCELFEKDSKKADNGLPDLFAERDKLCFGAYLEKRKPAGDGRLAIGVPRVLTMYESFPFWRAFFEELGADIILSGKTNQQIVHDAVEHITAETCFPIKIIHGHVVDLINRGANVIFMPSILTMSPKGSSKFKSSQMCPLVQANSYLVKNSMDLKMKGVELWEPVISFQRGYDSVASELGELGRRLGASADKVAGAVRVARDAQNAFYAGLKVRGREILANLKEDRQAVVIISRPYNGCDSGINMDLPRKLKDMGKMAIPVDMLDLSEDPIYENNPNMYWRSGQRIQAAAEVVRKNPKLNAIYISNFKCGPDSFITYHVQQQMMGKPYLHLEVDEHSADAGAITRCEAFFDSLENVDAGDYARRQWRKTARLNGHKRKLYIPWMCDHSYSMAAAFQHYGVDAEVLPKTDAASLEVGRRFSTGKECIPYTLVAGDVLKKALEKEFDATGASFFIPTTEGPCRLGQYQGVLRIQLDRLGHIDARLMAPSAEGNYSGFEGVGRNFKRMVWRGIVATDILIKLVHETRPYELVPGTTDKAYQQGLDIVLKSVRAGAKDIFERMNDVRSIFRAVPADKTVRRPIIGVVGEIYVRLHNYSNGNIIRRIEEMGGEAWLAPLGEWFFYCTDRFIAKSRRDGKIMELLSGMLLNSIKHRDEKKMMAPFKDDLLNWQEPPTSEVLARSAPYIDASFEGEATLSVGKALDYAGKGCAGIINLLPFGCMPGTVVSAVSKRVREDCGNIPWLNIDIDGMDENNGRSRLEAFVFQAKQYKERKTAESSMA